MRLRTRSVPTLAAAAIMLVIFAFGAVQYDHFASLSNISNLLNDYGYIAIAAVGATFVILLGGIDLSVGSVVAFTGVLMARLIGHGWHPLGAAGLCLAVGAALGCTMGVLIQVFEVPAFMVTLVGLFAIRALGFMILPQSTRIDHPFVTTASRGDLIHLADVAISWPMLLGAGVAAGAIILARCTPLGRRIYAVGGSERSARMMGVPIGATRIAVYTMAGVCSALAGCVFTISRQAGDPSCAVGLELTVIAAVVIGGTLLSGGVGSILGTIIGVLIIGLIRMIIDFEGTLNAAWTSIGTGVLLLVFVMLQKLISVLSVRVGYRGV